LGQYCYIAPLRVVICCNCENITGNGLLAEEVNIQIIGGLYENNTNKEIYLQYCYGFSIIGAYFEELADYHDVDSIYIKDVDGTGSKGGMISGCDFERNAVVEGTGYCINIANGHGIGIEGNHLWPHKDLAGMVGYAHIKIGAPCSNIRIGANSFRGLGFTNPCDIADVAQGATGIKIWNNISTLADVGKPSVAEGDTFLTGGTTTITDFADGAKGDEITILCKHSLTFDFTTAQDATHNLDGSSADITADTGDILRFLCENGTTWNLISNLDASEDNN